MLRITIKKALEQYDNNKGYVRALIKEEPHIKELRRFYEELKEDNLFPASLLNLALILIGKSTRTEQSESDKTFEALAKKLGGYEALDILNNSKQLTEESIVLLERYPTSGKTLAAFIVSISKNTLVGDRKKIFHALEKIKNHQELITIVKELELISRTEDAHFFINVLSILNNYDLNSDEVLPLLKETKHIIGINKILETLAKENPLLITLPNLINILKAKKHFLFCELFLNLPPNQQSLDSLFQANDTLNYWSKNIIINFKKGGWDIQLYLGTILSGKVDDWALNTATEELIKLELKSECLPLILQTIFAYSNECRALIEAVKTLNKEGLDERFLKLAFEVPKYSNEVAVALVVLQKARCFNEITQKYVCSNPKYALGLAQFWIQFSKAKCIDLSLRESMLKQPQRNFSKNCSIFW
ncbi:MAG: hypothetical protein QM652_00730 [Legionella sp.]|uniref:hypothetical protein n=1 Tax=Legionella sp. TaxID=459 RepID=UPI0039E34ACC